MTFASIQTLARTSFATAALALGAGLAACGGGGEDVASMQAHAAASNHRMPAASADAAPSVLVQGCVVDRHFIPATGTPVRVLTADGRLLGHAHSDAQGRFAFSLPARSAVMLQVDRPDGESLPMRVDARAPTWEQCLLDEGA